MTIRFGFVSTYPPTLCGLATFTAALSAELGDCRIVRLVDSLQPTVAAEVVSQMIAGDPASVADSAAALADCDVTIVQHEYGVFGGVDGDEVLDLLAALSMPTVVVLHTVLSSPTANQRVVLENVCAAADAVVVMTDSAHARLAAGYAVDMGKVNIIPHGAPVSAHGLAPVFRPVQQTILTWGLIGPGKGIEWGIEAMARLDDLVPAPTYHVAGQTHPKVLAHAGEAYRIGLQRRIDALGLAPRVRLDSQYRRSRALAELVQTADIVLLPYDSTDQITSGVLIEAVAALKPVVATRFPHAVELLSGGAGILVPHKDPDAIAAALRSLLTHRDIAAGMSRAAASTASSLLWPAVAGRYTELASRLRRSVAA